jgi:hypothetical protein
MKTQKRLAQTRRYEASMSEDSLERLKEMKRRGVLAVSPSEAAEILGGKRDRFYTMAGQGRLRRARGGGLEIDSLIQWVARGIAAKNIPAPPSNFKGLDMSALNDEDEINWPGWD